MAMNELLLAEFNEEMKKTRTALQARSAGQERLRASSEVNAARQTCPSRGPACRFLA